MKRYDDNDEFWSIESMLPPSAAKKKSFETKNDVSAVEIEISGADHSQKKHSIPPQSNQYPPISSSSGQKIDYSEWIKKRNEYMQTQKRSIQTLEKEYDPPSPLIRKVTVSSEASQAAFKERFLSDGEALYNKSCNFEGNEPYRAIFPQYASMSDRQKRCYVGFRTCVRNGSYPKVDEGYITLLLYEIINLTHKSTPQDMVNTVASLISGYPDVGDKLFFDMCNYLADLCLIHALAIPETIFGSVYSRVLKSARVKEVFIRANKSSSVCSLLVSASRYDFRTSKFYYDNKDIYDRYIEKAVECALEHIALTDSRFRDDRSDSFKLEYESFFGAYRTVNAKKRITLELAFVTRDDEVKRVVSELVKYAENCVRSVLMIKPRLTVSYVNREIKGIIKQYILKNTAYIAPASAKKTKTEAQPQIAEYEKLYEPKSTEVSFENALEIEKNSWQITDKLVSAFDESEILEDVEEARSETISKEQTSEAVAVPSTAGAIIEGLRLIYDGRQSELSVLAKRSGMLLGTLIDMINEFLLEQIGDIGLEGSDENVQIASWYTEDVEKILENNAN